jgi:nucleoside-diphosphate-sugar epimerase
MNVLITGVAGLTGSHLVRHCLEQGDTVVGIDNFFRGRQENIYDLIDDSGFQFIEADFRDYIAKHDAGSNYDGIYHLAAIVPTKYFYEEPTLTYEVNCQGTYDIFKWAVAHHIPGFVNASSSEIYGHASSFPTTEWSSSVYDSVETTTRWSYAYGKIITEYLLNHAKDEIRVCHLRYANVYGPYDIDENHVIPYILNRIACGEVCELNIKAAELRRSFAYMSDCAEATRLAMLNMSSGRSYNVGNPEDITILDLFNTAVEIMNELGVEYNKKPSFVMTRSGDPERRILDISRAHTELGYNPTVMLREGIRRTAQWILGQSR